jgi:hypothetical protein
MNISRSDRKAGDMSIVMHISCATSCCQKYIHICTGNCITDFRKKKYKKGIIEQPNTLLQSKFISIGGSILGWEC